jgi:prolyl-tRNA editing enzyme YbaK/EbsC (Cys-tRNA(Pro) deacylase)
LEKAKLHLKKYDMDVRIVEFDTSSATVAEAAIAANCSEGEIAKTLSFIVDSKPILIVVAGDCKIDNFKYKKEFNAKAKMISYESVEGLIGHQVGGVCPFGINDGVAVYLDESLKRFKMVYPACGSSNSAIKLTIPELEETSCYSKWVDVCKISD